MKEKSCHPERPQGVEGSTHCSDAVQNLNAKIPPRGALRLGRDDRCGSGRAMLAPTRRYKTKTPEALNLTSKKGQ